MNKKQQKERSIGILMLSDTLCNLSFSARLDFAIGLVFFNKWLKKRNKKLIVESFKLKKQIKHKRGKINE